MSVKKGNRLKSGVTAAAAAVALIILPLYAVKVWVKTDYTDFLVYYRAAARAAAGRWAQVYSAADGASPFRYAPPTIPFFRPFAALPERGAQLAWYFLQYTWFAAGFYFIYLTVERILRAHGRGGRREAAFVTSVSFLFIARFCLDCFTIGQVSSLLFLALCASFFLWTARRSGWASTALLPPALFKIGPGFLYPLLLHGRPRARLRAILSPLAALAATLAVTTAWLGPWSRNRMLWEGWLGMVRGDSTYYDASHYGSQSVKSALLRMARWHWITPETAARAYLAAGLLLCGAVLLFWVLRFPRKPMGRAASFALGLFPYVWVMPETFKYSLTVLAIPAALLVADLGRSRSRLSLAALGFGAATLSLAGKDIVGDFLFFGSQKISLPLVATFLLGAATAALAWRESRDSWVARELKGLARSRRIGPWGREQPTAILEASLLAPLPMRSKVSLDASAVLAFLRQSGARLEALYGKGRFEILVQPYGDRLSRFNPIWASLTALGGDLPGLRLADLAGKPISTRNEALREAFLASRGLSVLVAQLEQPCDPEFYVRAEEALRGGAELVRGNRRVHATRFRIPVRLLPLVYRRHRLGLAFNRLVRLVLPIETTDTHSGVLAMRRGLAARAFALQSSVDFLFDLEIALVARTHGCRQLDLPLTVHLAEEKSHPRLALETLSILLGLPRLSWRFRQGCYQPMRLTQALTADDWGLTPEVNQGILDLARRGVIRRVSLMARTAHLAQGLDELRRIPGVELGLHFDLTYGRGSPGRILLEWIHPWRDRGRLADEARAELRDQLARLAAAGVRPTYLDGHHHIHLVPGMIDAISAPLREAGIARVRRPYDRSLWLTPKAALNLLSIGAGRAIRRNGFESASCFYPQQGHFADPGLLRAGLARNPGAEVIVHPARSNDLLALGIDDPYTEGRVTEYLALRMLEHLVTEPVGEPST